jgi:hypothetical protein
MSSPLQLTFDDDHFQNCHQPFFLASSCDGCKDNWLMRRLTILCSVYEQYEVMHNRLNASPRINQLMLQLIDLPWLIATAFGNAATLPKYEVWIIY